MRLRALFIVFLCLLPLTASGDNCRQLIEGLKFAVPTSLIPSLRNDEIYRPRSDGQSRVPGWIETYYKGGKRLRPLMVYLSAIAQGHTSQSVEKLAGLIELIHLGSLSMDDLIDESTDRRGVVPLYLAEREAFGVVPGMITAPWLQAYVFKRGLEVTNSAVLGRMAEVLMEMGDGEILQAELKGRAKANGTYLEEEYFRVALGKTGHLFGFSLAATSLHIGAPRSQVETWYQLGKEVGVAYQIKDDFEDAMEEEGEINYAHKRRSLRFGGSPFRPMTADVLTILREEYEPVRKERARRLDVFLSNLQRAQPGSLSPEQLDAFATLRDMVDFVTECPTAPNS